MVAYVTGGYATSDWVGGGVGGHLRHCWLWYL